MNAALKLLGIIILTVSGVNRELTKLRGKCNLRKFYTSHCRDKCLSWQCSELNKEVILQHSRRGDTSRHCAETFLRLFLLARPGNIYVYVYRFRGHTTQVNKFISSICVFI